MAVSTSGNRAPALLLVMASATIASIGYGLHAGDPFPFGLIGLGVGGLIAGILLVARLSR